jgi:hypothetical protein
MDSKEFRHVGHRVVDLLADDLDAIQEKRVFPEAEPRTTTKLFAEPLPPSKPRDCPSSAAQHSS